MHDQGELSAPEPTLESVMTGIRESVNRIGKANADTTDQIYRLGFAQAPPAAPVGATTGTGIAQPGRERTAMERLIELGTQLESAAHDSEWNHKHLQKQF